MFSSNAVLIPQVVLTYSVTAQAYGVRALAYADLASAGRALRDLPPGMA